MTTHRIVNYGDETVGDDIDIEPTDGTDTPPGRRRRKAREVLDFIIEHPGDRFIFEQGPELDLADAVERMGTEYGVAL